MDLVKKEKIAWKIDVEMLSKALSYLKNTNITGMDLI